MTYNIGDEVFITDADCREDITAGVPYRVVRVMLTSIEIIDDANDEHAINTDHVMLVVTDEDEGAYEERKANIKVTSTGLFEKGDVLVYLDGTPTLTSLTVMWCTATAVVFEETYSMPFNPAEFRRECQ
jgi:hypothetical protein